LQITAEHGQWRRVEDADGMGGWVHHALLSGVRTALVQGETAVPLRAGPDEGATVRAMAEPGVVGRLEACEAAWCEISAGGVDGWLPRAAIWGVGPDEVVED
jgi:SH3-like domain-containing protein